MLWWQAFGLCVGAAALTWMVSAVFDTRGPVRVIGPYHVPFTVEVCVGALAVAAGLASVAALVRRQSHANRGPTFATTATLIFTCAFVTAWWRTATAIGEGANIGGGMFVLAAPVLIAGLLIAAVPIQIATRRRGG